MNELIAVLKEALEACKKKGSLKLENPPEILLEAPKLASHGDLATNIALLLSRSESKPPRKIAEEIIANIQTPSDIILDASVAGPGFINFKLAPKFVLTGLSKIYKAGEKYGCSNLGGGKKIQVEFVSANPTGPLHVGHGRGAVYGDCLARVLSAGGYKVTKEYYLNDAGVQMQTLGKSVFLRMKELRGGQVDFPENCYQGDYIKDIARELLGKSQIPRHKTSGQANSKSEEEFINFCGQYAGKKIHEEIIKDLADLGVTHDNFFYETTLHKKDEVAKTIEFLRKRGLVYDDDGAVWFKTTDFGDEKDRVLKKSDGTYTYFAADIAYHKDKYDRGLDRVVDVWGADHAGHVVRMKAAIQALGHDPGKLDVVLIQLVNLIRKGELISMSTRSAQYETLRTLLDEVGKDVCRYFFLMRSHNAQLDFDLELATSQTMDNPVYYIQYAHARIASVFEKAPKFKTLSEADVNLLNLPEELELARFLDEYPNVVETAAMELEPHQITFYLLELAKKFQSYYTKGKKDSRYRFLSDDPDLTLAKCYLLKNIQIVIKNGLSLLGISAPTRMESKDE